MAITSNNISAQAGFVCPSLYDNISMLKFIDPYKLCVVKGSNAIACVCLKNFFVPITVWNESIVVLEPGETQKVSLGMVADFGKRREIYGYELLMYLPGTPQADVPLKLNVTCVEKTINETISFDTGTAFSTTITNLKAAINANTKIKNEIEIIEVDEDLKSFQIRAVNKGYEFGYILSYAASPSTIIPTTSIQTAKRYKYGRCKFIFIEPLYNEAVVPPLASNNKHIQYAYDDDYQINGPSATFRNLGKMFIHSSDDDVDETDMNLIETVWLKNTHTETLQIQILVAR